MLTFHVPACQPDLRPRAPDGLSEVGVGQGVQLLLDGGIDLGRCRRVESDLAHPTESRLRFDFGRSRSGVSGKKRPRIWLATVSILKRRPTLSCFLTKGRFSGLGLLRCMIGDAPR